MCRTIYGRATLVTSDTHAVAEIRQDAGCEDALLSRQEAILGASPSECHRLAVIAIKGLIEAISRDMAPCLRNKRDAVNDLWGLLLAVEAKRRLSVRV